MLGSLVIHLAALLFPLGQLPRPPAPVVLHAFLVSVARPQVPAPKAQVLPPALPTPPTPAAPAAPSPTLPAVPDARPAPPLEDPPGLLPPVVEYLRASQLTKAPSLHTLPSVNPPDIDDIVGGGQLVIEVFINEDGGADAVDVVDDFAPSRLREHALKTFREARYVPGELLGKPVKSRLKVELSLAPPPALQPAMPTPPQP